MRKKTVSLPEHLDKEVADVDAFYVANEQQAKKLYEDNAQFAGIDYAVQGPPVEVVEPVVKKPVTLTETLKQAFTGPGEAKEPTSTRKPRAKKEDSSSLLVAIASIIIMVLLMWLNYVTHPLYGRAIPTQAELESVAKPALRIIGRRIKVTARMSDDLLDVLDMMKSGLVVTLRCIQTKMELDAMYGKGASLDKGTSTRDFGQFSAYSRNGHSRQESVDVRTGDTASNAHDGEASPPENGRGEVDIIAQAAQRDFEYRQQQGLI